MWIKRVTLVGGASCPDITSEQARTGVGNADLRYLRKCISHISFMVDYWLSTYQSIQVQRAPILWGFSSVC